MFFIQLALLLMIPEEDLRRARIALRCALVIAEAGPDRTGLCLPGFPSCPYRVLPGRCPYHRYASSLTGRMEHVHLSEPRTCNGRRTENSVQNISKLPSETFPPIVRPYNLYFEENTICTHISEETLERRASVWLVL